MGKHTIIIIANDKKRRRRKRIKKAKPNYGKDLVCKYCNKKKERTALYTIIVKSKDNKETGEEE